jgi:hypothetical protein
VHILENVVELSKAFSVHADYKDRRPPSWEMFLFADVVFIDKTNSLIVSHVFQLNDAPDHPQLSLLINNATTSWKDNCTLLGNLQELDKHKKLIHLESKQVVSYKHLIIINGKKPLISTINHEITNALQVLVEALKVNPNVDSLLLPSWSLRHVPKNQAHGSDIPHKESTNNIAKATQSYFVECEKVKNSFGLDALNERLYEIYI